MAYATRTELKSLLKITDTDRDAQLDDALAAAEAAVDQRCGRTFTLATEASARTFSARRQVLSTADGQRLILRTDIGSTDDLAVAIGTTGAWTTITASVETWPLNALAEGRPITSLLLLGGAWPSSGGQRVQVTARWGWPSVPEPVQQATRILAMRLWKRKDSVEGMVGSAEWGVARISRVDPDVEALLAPYACPWMA